MSSNVVTEICDRLRRALGDRTDPVQSIGPLADHDTFSLAPWPMWTLLYLVRHRERQTWVANVVRYQLGGCLSELAACGALAHPDIPPRGLVPGDREWEYFFHGRGCCISHRGTGESIDVDFYDETGDWFDAFFVINHLESLTSPDFIAARLVELHSSERTLRIEFQELIARGVLEKHPDSGVFRLASPCDELLQLLDAVELDWENRSLRALYAASLGDWLLVESLADTEDVQATVPRRAVQCHQERTDLLLRLFEQESDRASALAALDDLRSPRLPEYLKLALAGPLNGTVSVALDIIERLNSEEWCRPISTLINRVDPNGPIPQPHIWTRCSEFLLRHGVGPEAIRRRLKSVDSLALGESAVLALEYAPELAVDLFRKALRSRIPHNRIVAAAVLGLVDAEWSRRELAAVLQESNEQLPTAECRAALLESRSPAMHALVQQWEADHPHEPELGRFISMQESMLLNCGETIRYEMQTWHERIMPLRCRVPPLPRRTWWQRLVGRGEEHGA